MAIFGIGTTTQVTLSAKLSQVAATLRLTQEREAQAAQFLLEEAQRAKIESAVAATHADAVERALTILEDAGVTL